MLTRYITSNEVRKELLTTGFAHRNPSIAAMVLSGSVPFFQRHADGTEVAIKVVPSPAEPSGPLPERRDAAAEPTSASADLARTACTAAGVGLPSFEKHSPAPTTGEERTGGTSSASAEIADSAMRAATTGLRETETNNSASASIADAATHAAGLR